MNRRSSFSQFASPDRAECGEHILGGFAACKCTAQSIVGANEMSVEPHADPIPIELILTPAKRQSVRIILNQYAFGRSTFAFGSRVVACEEDYQRVKRHSDLDIALAEPALSLTEMDELRDAFSQSDLPMRVDIANAADLPSEWKVHAWPL